MTHLGSTPHVYRLHRGCAWATNETGVDIWRLGDRRRFRLRSSTAPLGRVLDLLREGVPASNRGLAHAAERAEIDPSHFRRVLSELSKRGIVLRRPESDAPAIPDAGDGRGLYDPQIAYFERRERENLAGPEMNERLQARRVVVIGLGGLGSWIALLMARIGIREIVAVDYDRVELSNLSRQVLYRRSDIGNLKVEAAADAVAAADPTVRYEPYALRVASRSDALPIVRGADLVVIPQGYGRSPSRDAVASACIETSVPYLVSGGFVFGPLWVPGVTACHDCLLSSDGLGEGYLADRTQFASGTMSGDGPFAPVLALAASFVVLDLARFLSDSAPAHTTNGIVMFDPATYRTERRAVFRQPNCPTCIRTPQAVGGLQE